MGGACDVMVGDGTPGGIHEPKLDARPQGVEPWCIRGGGDDLIHGLGLHPVSSATHFPSASLAQTPPGLPQDLSLMGRPLSRIVIIDNSPTSFLFQPRNSIQCTSCPGPWIGALAGIGSRWRSSQKPIPGGMPLKSLPKMPSKRAHQGNTPIPFPPLVHYCLKCKLLRNSSRMPITGTTNSAVLAAV